MGDSILGSPQHGSVRWGNLAILSRDRVHAGIWDLLYTVYTIWPDEEGFEGFLHEMGDGARCPKCS